MMHLLMLACQNGVEKDALENDSTSNSDSNTDVVDIVDSATASTLNGTPPSQPLAVSSLSATNHDGQPRNQNDLIGNPTVISFYPAAGTYG